MLKSGHNFISRFLFRKPGSKVRNDSYWTDFYPSPETSIMKKVVDKTCEWVYGNIDSFFQGSSTRNQTAFDNCFPGIIDLSSKYSQEWELNQGVVDIALKDIQGSLSWILPGFIKQFANRLHHQLLLYFFTDAIFEEESSDRNYKGVPHAVQKSVDKGKFIFAIQEFNEVIDSKLLSIGDWWIKLFHQLGFFLRLEPQKKTYYLLGSFAPQGYDYSIDNQNYMIRGPDKTNLNPALSIQKRN